MELDDVMQMMITTPEGDPVPVVALRDQFAMAALQGLLSGSPDVGIGPEGYAKDAYLYADAMLAAREEK